MCTIESSKTLCIKPHHKAKGSMGENFSAPPKIHKSNCVVKPTKEGKHITLETVDTMGPSISLYPLISPKK